MKLNQVEAKAPGNKTNSFIYKKLFSVILPLKKKKMTVQVKEVQDIWKISL